MGRRVRRGGWMGRRSFRRGIGSIRLRSSGCWFGGRRTCHSLCSTPRRYYCHYCQKSHAVHNSLDRPAHTSSSSNPHTNNPPRLSQDTRAHKTSYSDPQSNSYSPDTTPHTDAYYYPHTHHSLHNPSEAPHNAGYEYYPMSHLYRPPRKSVSGFARST
jgi:hypothetical protein